MTDSSRNIIIIISFHGSLCFRAAFYQRLVGRKWRLFHKAPTWMEHVQFILMKLEACCILVYLQSHPRCSTDSNQCMPLSGHRGRGAAFQWRHNEHTGVSYHQPHDCLLTRLFRHRSKEASKLQVTDLCAGNSPATGEFPAQRTSNAKNVSILWRHNCVVLQPHVSLDVYPLWLVYVCVCMCQC